MNASARMMDGRETAGIELGVKVSPGVSCFHCNCLQECSDRPKRRSIAAFEQLVAIKRKRAHVGRDQA